jgi:antitoxin component of MazEF toxin-antitoxin module
MTLDADGGCFLPVELLQEVGWQPGEKLTVESAGGVIRIGRADPPKSDAQASSSGRLNEGISQPGK